MKRIAFYVMCVLLLGCTKDEKRTIVCWGDSLTMQHKDYGIRGNLEKWLSGNFIDDSYPGFLEEMIGDEYKIINCGVGGENTLTIAGRQGSIPMFIAIDMIFDNGIDEVTIDNSILRSSWDSTVIAPLQQSRWKEGSPARINPCRIGQQEIFLKCERIENDGNTMFRYALERTENLNQKTIIKGGSLITTEASQHLRKPHINVFFAGQNGGYKNISDYIAQLKRMIEYGQSTRYIVISFHKPNHVINDVNGMKEMEDSLSITFKSHFINLRSYMVSNGLKDACLTASSEDLDSVKHGQVPPQLMTDGTHFNAHGCRLIATLIKRKIEELGY